MDQITPWRVLRRLKLHQMSEAELDHYIDVAWWMQQVSDTERARIAYKRRQLMAEHEKRSRNASIDRHASSGG